MFESFCLDEYGNTIYNLTQWDINQKLIVDVENYILDTAPMVHFCNKNYDKTLDVQSTLSDNKIVADIPNILLKEPLTITAYIYLMSNQSGKTVKVIEIPVRQRPQPSDYEYEDNVDIITITQLIQEVNALKVTVEASEKVREENEQTRINNEILREQNVNLAIENANNAATAANEAAQNITNNYATVEEVLTYLNLR